MFAWSKKMVKVAKRGREEDEPEARNEDVAWMKRLGGQLKHFGQKNMLQAVIPGRAADMDDTLVKITKACNSLGLSVGNEIVSNFAVTQASNIFGQLNLGVRYIDLRLQVESKDVIFCVHALLGATLQAVLASLERWASWYETEIVVVHVQKIHTEALKHLSKNQLFQMVKDMFNSHKILYKDEAALLLPLEELWKQRVTFILVGPEIDVDNPWFNTPSAVELRSKLANSLPGLEKTSKDGKQLVVLQTILSPSEEVIINGVKDKLGANKVLNILSFGTTKHDDPQSLHSLILRQAGELAQVTQFGVFEMAKNGCGCVFLSDFPQMIPSTNSEMLTAESLLSEAQHKKSPVVFNKDAHKFVVDKAKLLTKSQWPVVALNCPSQIKLAVAANCLIDSLQL